MGEVVSPNPGETITTALTLHMTIRNMAARVGSEVMENVKSFILGQKREQMCGS
jgi:hypothetical protein